MHILQFAYLEDKACMELMHFRQGNDIDDHKFPEGTYSATAINCQKLCQREQRCQYFTWDETYLEGKKEKEGRCWIKTEKPAISYYSKLAVSGPKNCSGTFFG